MKIVSKGFTEGFYYKPRVDLAVLKEYHEGIIALSACLAGEVAGIFREECTKMQRQQLFVIRIFLAKGISSWNYRIMESLRRDW